jgi:hypothetical protein
MFSIGNTRRGGKGDGPMDTAFPAGRHPAAEPTDFMD